MRDQRTLREIDFSQEHADLERAVRRQLRKRGIENRDELADRIQDGLALLFVRSQRRPGDPVALAVWCCAGDAARGRTVHRETAHNYVDAFNPLDQRERSKIVRGEREAFDRRAQLAQMDLDEMPRVARLDRHPRRAASLATVVDTHTDSDAVDMLDELVCTA